MSMVSNHFIDATPYQPGEADWREYAAYLASLPVQYPEPEEDTPEPFNPEEMPF